MATQIFFKCSPQKLGKMNPFWLTFFRWLGSTTNQFLSWKLHVSLHVTYKAQKSQSIGIPMTEPKHCCWGDSWTPQSSYSDKMMLTCLQKRIFHPPKQTVRNSYVLGVSQHASGINRYSLILNMWAVIILVVTCILGGTQPMPLPPSRTWRIIPGRK